MPKHASSARVTIDDFNRGDHTGSSYFQVTQKAGWRWSAADAFLRPVLHRPNLRLQTHALVHRIVIENGRAVGVEFDVDGQGFIARARREVVLSAVRSDRRQSSSGPASAMARA